MVTGGSLFIIVQGTIPWETKQVLGSKMSVLQMKIMLFETAEFVSRTGGVSAVMSQVRPPIGRTASKPGISLMQQHQCR